MRTFFLFFSIVCFLLWLATVKENFIDPVQQQGSVNQLTSLINSSGVTSSEIQVLQDQTDEQTNDIARIEAILAQIESK
jgi:hypothetical protein